MADPLFKKEMYFNQNTDLQQTRKNKWFDKDCFGAKERYKKALFIYNRSKTVTNRQFLAEEKAAYKKILTKKKREFKRNETKKLLDLRKSSPRQFWKHFKTQNKVEPNISSKDFMTYFSDLFSSIETVPLTEAESFNENYDFNSNDDNFSELDYPISTQEVVKAIRNMNTYKAASHYYIMNEYFIATSDILAAHIADIFNFILDTGYFPKQWAKSIIVPLHKKGNINQPDNYRGITLLSCMGKLFSSIVTNRLSLWCENNNVISDAQFGFRKGKSTIDAIFILKCMIDKLLNSNERLYCAFIDLKKAFDSVYRNALWLKLFKLGIKGKLLRVIHSMYTSVKASVKFKGSQSEYFDILVGLKQGDNLSPILFSLFLEDLELSLQN